MRSVSVTITYDTKNKIKDTNFWRSQTITTVGSRGATSSRDATDAEVTQYLGAVAVIPKSNNTSAANSNSSNNQTPSKDQGSNTSGWKLGIQIGDTPAGKNIKGALIESVNEDGLAAKAGIAVGDIITKVNGSIALSKDDLANKIRAANSDAPLSLQIMTKGKVRNIVIQPTKRNNSTSL
jgi:C-terminal processing protease CtpA/Prc